MNLSSKLFRFCLFWLFVTQTCLLANTHPLLNTYAQLHDALLQGSEVRAVISFDKCKPADGSSNKITAFGGLRFDNFVIYSAMVHDTPTQVIASSTNMLVKHHKYGPVYNYVRLRIFENNFAELYSAFINASNYNELQSSSYICELSADKDNRGIALFNLSE
jgi:hypothetical protein